MQIEFFNVRRFDEHYGFKKLEFSGNYFLLGALQVSVRVLSTGLSRLLSPTCPGPSNYFFFFS